MKNEEISLLLGEQKGILDYIRDMVEKLDHTVNGNSKPGLVQDVKDLRRDINSHICEAEEVKESLEATEKEKKLAIKNSKEKWGNRTWALVATFLGVFITEGAMLLLILARLPAK